MFLTNKTAVVVYIIYIFTLYRTSTEDEHKVLVTSSNEAYGVVSVGEEHEYDVV